MYFPFSLFSAKSIARDLEERDEVRPVRRKPGSSSKGSKATEQPPNGSSVKSTETSPSKPGKSSETTNKLVDKSHGKNNSSVKSIETSPSKPGKSSEDTNKPVDKSHGKKAAKISVEDAINDINQMKNDDTLDEVFDDIFLTLKKLFDIL